MKSHDLAKNLEQWAETLKANPNVEMNEIFSTLVSLVANKSLPQEKSQKKEEKTTELPRDIEKKLASMAPKDIESYLLQDKIFPAKNLLKLAETLGVKSSKRQNRNALANLITKHYESGQIDMLLRSSKRKSQEGTEPQTTPEQYREAGNPNEKNEDPSS